MAVLIFPFSFRYRFPFAFFVRCHNHSISFACSHSPSILCAQLQKVTTNNSHSRMIFLAPVRNLKLQSHFHKLVHLTLSHLFIVCILHISIEMKVQILQSENKLGIWRSWFNFIEALWTSQNSKEFLLPILIWKKNKKKCICI